jgi:hypothetical protein
MNSNELFMCSSQKATATRRESLPPFLFVTDCILTFRAPIFVVLRESVAFEKEEDLRRP